MEQKLNRYLVRKTDKAVYPWTENLAKRKDFAEVWARDPKSALESDNMPEPQHVTLAQLEAMPKKDLIIFGKVKLGLDMPLDTKIADLLTEIKIAIFNRPVTRTDDDVVGPAKEKTAPMSSAAAARSQVGM